MKPATLISAILLAFSAALHAQIAPVTTAGRVTNAVPGDPAVPVAVTVSGFEQIGQFTLTLKFDITRVQFVSATVNAALTGMAVNYLPPVTGTQGTLLFSWTGAANLSLPDGSALAGLTFHYVSGTGLLWWANTFGSVCQYKRYNGNTLTILGDVPRYQYYQNGGISNRGAPVLTAPQLFDPVPGALSVPLLADGFTDIASMTLYLEYDPLFITYQHSFTKHPAFDSNFIVGDQAGAGGKRQVVIQWYGSPVSLADGTTLCTLAFNYLTASCQSSPLQWYDSGPSCEFADSQGCVLIDLPGADYYLDGLVGHGLPVRWTGSISGDWDDPANWDDCGMPEPDRRVVIPNVAPLAFPVINTQKSCRSLMLETGAELRIEAGGAMVVTE